MLDVDGIAIVAVMNRADAWVELEEWARKQPRHPGDVLDVILAKLAKGNK